MCNIENLFYCKKNCFKVQNNIDFEFKKDEYYHITESGIKLIIDNMNKNIIEYKTLTFIVDGYEYEYDFTEKEFYEHFLSEEKN